MSGSLPAAAAAAFVPDVARAHRFDARMRQRLAGSLRYLAARVAGHLPLPEGFEAALSRISAAPVSPLVFGAYYELVLAIEDDALERAAALLEEIACTPTPPEALRIVELADPARDPSAARIRRLVDTDPDLPFEILPPPPALAATCRAHLDAALALIEAGVPELGAEIRALVRLLVLAVGPEAPDALTFDGASSFMLWGAVVLNARSPRNRLDAAQALAHESGHNLLFGFAIDGALVENDDEERHPSPLRLDPRPLDGILHATFVSARMHYTLCRLVDAEVLEPAERDAALREIEANEKRFADGCGTLDRHARLSTVGASAITAARAWMHAARGREGRWPGGRPGG